jgi:hypothetical protein
MEGDDISPELICQVRVPKSVNPNPKTTRIYLATCTGEDGHFLWGYHQKEQKEEKNAFIFEPDEFLLDEEPDSRRAIIICDYRTPEQFFPLSVPRNPKVQDWSQWQRPDFLAKGDAGWAFMYNQKMQGIITNVPSDCFELRYKIEICNLGSTNATIPKQKTNASK